MKSGQFTIEFVVVLALFLTVLATVSIPLYNNSRDTAEQSKIMMDAREAANRLASQIDSAYSGGIGTSRQARYWLPGKVTKIESGSIDDELTVELTLDIKETKTVRVDTQLPADWNDRVNLNQIETNENRQLHETVIRFIENEDLDDKELMISFSDKLIEVE